MNTEDLAIRILDAVLEGLEIECEDEYKRSNAIGFTEEILDEFIESITKE